MTPIEKDWGCSGINQGFCSHLGCLKHHYFLAVKVSFRGHSKEKKMSTSVGSFPEQRPVIEPFLFW